MTFHSSWYQRAVALSVAGATLALPVVASASTKPTVASILQLTQAQLRQEKSVHIAVTSVSPSTKTSIVVDLAAKKGRETLRSGAMYVQVLVTPSDAYLRGNAQGLESVMGLSAAQVKKMGAKAVEMKSGTAPYKNLTKNLTTAVFSQLLPKVKGTTMSAPNTKSKDFKITWVTSSGAAAKTKNVMVISSGKKHLPVSQTIYASGGHGTTTYSKWNESFTVKVPASSKTVTYKSIFG